MNRLPNESTGNDLEFMNKIRESFVSYQSNQFLLTGNVNDIYRCAAKSEDQTFAESEYVSLPKFLNARLSAHGRLLINYNIARGIRFASDEQKEKALTVYLTLFNPQDQTVGRESFHDVLAKSSAYVYPSLVFLQKLCLAATRSTGAAQLSFAVIIEHVETILPNVPIPQMNDADRQRLILFREWLTDPAFIESQNIMLLISETISAVNESVRLLPHLIRINIALPPSSERRAFIRRHLKSQPKLKLAGSQKSFVELSAGMTLLGIQQTMHLAQYTNGRLTKHDILFYLNRLLVSRIGDYVEIVRPAHNLTQVIGNTTLKTQLQRLTKALASANPETAPVGILITGPNGVGKTYIAMAWAGECDRIVLVLKNLRSSYFGETDQIFEKVRNVLEVLGNVIIIVDEADTVFAKPGLNTHATEQRLFGNVIRMMGDSLNRSRIVWVLMTARPDNLAPDFKRGGRCGLHLPIFDPEGDDRIKFVDYVLSAVDIELADFDAQEKERLLTMTANFSPADFRELIVEIRLDAEIARSPVSPQTCFKILDDYIPGDITVQRRLQTLHALLHCSRRSLIPPSLRALGKDEVYREIAQISMR